MKKFWQKLKDVKENGVTIATTALSSSSSSSSSSAAAAGAAAATTTASVGDKTTDPTKLDQAVKELQQKYSQLEKKKLDAKAKLDNACDNETKRALQVEFATANIASAGAKKDWEAALHFRRQMLTNKFQFDHKKGTVVKINKLIKDKKQHV